MRKRSFALVMSIVMLLGLCLPIPSLAAAQKITAKLSATSFEQGKSVTLSYTLTQKADAKITIVAANGLIAAQYTHKAVAAKKAKTLAWNGKTTKVNGLGLASGALVPTGKFSVRIESAGALKKLSVTVKPKAIKVKSVKLNKSKLSLAVKASETLTATVSPSNATNKGVTWKSSEPKVATVSSKGVVKGVQAGIAKITVTTKDGAKSASCTVTVVKASGATPTPTKAPTKAPTTAPTKAPTPTPTKVPTPTPAPTINPQVVGNWTYSHIGQVSVITNQARETFHLTLESSGTYRFRHLIEINLGGSFGYYPFSDDITAGTFRTSGSSLIFTGGELAGTRTFIISGDTLNLTGVGPLTRTDSPAPTPPADPDPVHSRNPAITIPSNPTPGKVGANPWQAILGSATVDFATAENDPGLYDGDNNRHYMLRLELSGEIKGRDFYNNTNQPLTCAWLQNGQWLEWTDCLPCPDTQEVLWLNFYTQAAVAKTGLFRLTWKHYIIYFDVATNKVYTSRPY